MRFNRGGTDAGSVSSFDENRQSGCRLDKLAITDYQLVRMEGPTDKELHLVDGMHIAGLLEYGRWGKATDSDTTNRPSTQDRFSTRKCVT